MRKLIEIIFAFLLVENSLAITRIGSIRTHAINDWRVSYERNEPVNHYQDKYRDSRSTDDYPAPQLPWEEALRHSIYLTLVRDKIDQLISKNGAFKHHSSKHDYENGETHEETDINLWREIRRAPFKAHNKDRGPIFGDIAILSRGKLVHTQQGLVFIEDENAKECIECHIYSARPNELEAEKTLRASCKGPNCENQLVKALWTVRRIRHRNHDDNSKSPYRFELMFSIASAKSDSDNLDYNTPTQTFTITETERPRLEEFGRKTTIPYIYSKPTFDENIFINQKKLNSFDQIEPHTEKTYWVHKNLNYRQHPTVPSNSIKFPDYYNHHQGVSGGHLLNTGEVYTERNQNIRNKPYYYEGGFTQSDIPLNTKSSRGQKKFEKTDKIYLENDYTQSIDPKKNIRQPTITHLHHHYYLNDKGIPILKIPAESIKNNYEQFLPNIYEDSVTKIIDNSPTIENENIRTSFYIPQPETYHHDTPTSASKTASNTFNNLLTIPVYVPETEIQHNENATYITHSDVSMPSFSTKPLTLQMAFANSRDSIKPTKPFRPSPEDIKVRYSELDPLYPPTLSTPTSYITEAQIEFIGSSTHDNINTSENPQLISAHSLEVTNKHTTNPVIDNRVTASSGISIVSSTPTYHYFSENSEPETTLEQHNSESATEEISTQTASTNQMTVPTLTTQTKETTKHTGRRRIERPIRKPIRRTKLQKNFSELINAQLSPPDKNTGTTLPYNITPVTQSSLESISEPDVTQSDTSIAPTSTMTSDKIVERKNKTSNFSPRNPRQKYQRKPGFWSPRRTRVRTTNTIEKRTTIATNNNSVESELMHHNESVHEDLQQNDTKNDIQLTNMTTEQNIHTTLIYPDATNINDNDTETNTTRSYPEEFKETILAIDDSFSGSMDLTTISDRINVESSISTPTDLDTDTTLLTSLSYSNTSHTAYEDLYTPLTKKSLVTSISLKLGNKTRPYFPSSTPTTKNDLHEKEHWVENSTIMDVLFSDIDFKNAMKAKISEIKGKSKKFKVYRAEHESRTPSIQQHQSDDNDDIAHQIIEHAKTLNTTN